MKLLAFDTSTEVMSVAVTRLHEGAQHVWQHTGAGGAQASSGLIPAIQALMLQAGLRFEELDAIVFGQGPGSFTGLRTACSVAQGLAFGTTAKLPPGAGVRLLPVGTLLAVAEEARFASAAHSSVWQVLALLDARMDELYAGYYEFNSGLWNMNKGYQLIRPEALDVQPVQAWAGNVFGLYGSRLPLAENVPRIQALPTAAAMLRLAPAFLAAGQAIAPELALPLYIRDKVAKTTLERAAEK